jgi:hypothetical protein
MSTSCMTSPYRLGAIALVAATISAAPIASAQGRQAGAAAQGRQGGPLDFWSLVPAFATSCYREDDFFDKIEAARTALAAEIEKQDKINAAAREKFDNMDGMEKAQRMQAFMMKNPQEAMKIMQAQQAAGAAGTAALEESIESGTRLEAELKQLQAAFKAANEQARKPILARQDALIKAKSVPGGTGDPMWTNVADRAQHVQLVAEENAAFERACAPFFGPNGSFHKWTSSYRTEVLDKMAGDAGETAMANQMKLFDMPGGNYRSTTPMQHASDFLRRVREIWAIRPDKTKPWVDVRK